MIETLQQAHGFVGTLGSGKLQPVPGLQRLALTRLAIEAAKLQLSSQVAGAGGLTQQLLTDTAIAGIAAIAAQQLAEAALRRDHALAGRLLEQASGEALDGGVMPQAGTIEQPESQTNR